MIGDGIVDDTEKFLLRVGRLDGQAMEQLDHQTSKALESTRDAHRGRDLDQDALGGGDVDLQSSCLVDGRIKQGKQALEDSKSHKSVTD